MINKIIRIIATPYGLLIISGIALLIGRFVFKKKYLNCIQIIVRHFTCFKKHNGKYSITSVGLYFGVPFLIALALVKIKEIDTDVVNMLTIIISILTSMFFTMLTLILDMRKKVLSNPNYDANKASVSAKVLKETYYAIMFEILLSIAILMMCFIEMFSSNFSRYTSVIIYYLTFVLLTNLFMVLKRIFNVIDNDLDIQDNN